MEKSRAPAAAGEVLLGKYRVEGTLGRGGMGVVVAARHIDLQELFAIKLMITDGAASPEAIERFLREARAAARIKSEHVARVQDVGRLPDGTPYMVMEYLEGADLRRVLRTHGPPAVPEAVALVLQACETLSEAHGLGIIHRDVKPANIFLTHRRNGSPCVKVLDFGISKHTGRDAIGLTTTATVGGSPHYMSPEQIRSTKHVDARTDVWSVGVVLYELLTGATPFYAEVVTAVVGRVLQEEPEPPSHLRPGIPPALDAAVLRCLAKDPDGRFSSVDELAAALRAAVGLPLTPEPPATESRPSWGAVPIPERTSAAPAPVVTPSISAERVADAGSTSVGLQPTTVTHFPSGARSKGLLAAILGGGLVIGLVAGAVVFLGQAGASAPDGAPDAASSEAAAPGIPAPAAAPSPVAAAESAASAEAPVPTVSPAPSGTPSTAPSSSAVAAPGTSLIAGPSAPAKTAAPPASKPAPTTSGRTRGTIH